MKKENIYFGASCSIIDVQLVIDFVLKIVRIDRGFEDFILEQPTLFQLRSYIANQVKNPLPLANEELTNIQFSENIIDTLKYLKGMSCYKSHLQKVDKVNLSKILKESKIPRGDMTQYINSIAFDNLEPADCQSLLDWPSRRLPANGHSGRLENAGQFINRLFEQGLYDEEKFGRLYISDLRKINSKLYQALVQWQKRTGCSLDMLGTKSEAAAARFEAYQRGELQDFEEIARIHSRSTKARKRNDFS